MARCDDKQTLEAHAIASLLSDSALVSKSHDAREVYVMDDLLTTSAASFIAL